MENNGRGIFYGVIGVATLVVAIVGATFAFFSASATQTGDTITGATNNDLAAALSVKVTRVVYENTTSPSLSLVPATMDDTQATGVTAALASKCEKDGYTGCHVYKIEANTTQTVANAQVLLDLSTDATVKTNWKHLIYTGTESSATAITTAAASIGNGITGEAIHNDALTAGTVDDNPSVTYYLVVYLANTASSQNEAGASSETGTYTGTVTMNAAGGEVSANFTAEG